MKTRFFFVLLAVIVALGLTGVALAQEPAGDFAVVQQAADSYLSSGKKPVMSADQLFETLNDGDPSNDPFILSVRKAEHYAAGHIPGAINIPWKKVAESDNLAKLPMDKRIVAYCYTGHTGMVSATILGVLGYDVGNMKFGMMGWTKDDEVLATSRFDPATQPDYMLEASALPTTGGDLTTEWMALISAGLAALGAGLALRRRAAVTG